MTVFLMLTAHDTYVCMMQKVLQILNGPIDLRIVFIQTVIYPCFIRHNYCETVKVPVNNDAIQKECEDARAKQSCTHHIEE